MLCESILSFDNKILDHMGWDFVDGDPVCDDRGEGQRFAGASARQHEDRSGVRSSLDLGFW